MAVQISKLIFVMRAFTNTGNFQKWSTLRKTGIKIAAGKHIVRVVVDSSAGHKYAGNLNWFKFS